MPRGGSSSARDPTPDLRHPPKDCGAAFYARAFGPAILLATPTSWGCIEINRRHFIVLVVAGAAILPLGAQAQLGQGLADRVYRTQTRKVL